MNMMWGPGFFFFSFFLYERSSVYLHLTLMVVHTAELPGSKSKKKRWPDFLLAISLGQIQDKLKAKPEKSLLAKIGA